ncbi:MAG: hypothetical protein EH225_13465, partial [Calditrichaeota bacterium]
MFKKSIFFSILLSASFLLSQTPLESGLRNNLKEADPSAGIGSVFQEQSVDAQKTDPLLRMIMGKIKTSSEKGDFAQNITRLTRNAQGDYLIPIFIKSKNVVSTVSKIQQ